MRLTAHCEGLCHVIFTNYTKENFRYKLNTKVNIKNFIEQSPSTLFDFSNLYTSIPYDLLKSRTTCTLQFHTTYSSPARLVHFNSIRLTQVPHDLYTSIPYDLLKSHTNALPSSIALLSDLFFYS